MGQHADDAVNDMFDMEGYRQDYRLGFISEDDACDMGILDEYGSEISSSYPRAVQSGPGKCPVCKADTVKKKGKFGTFYGCTNFPTCKGSRNE